MSHYLKMVLFVVILGFFTSALLLGVDALTAERIQANQAFELKATILDAYGIEYTFATANDVFDENVDIREADGLIFYVDMTTGAVSFEFSGGGVWGPIEGIITLEPDFETIRSIAILQQEETPGLGGVIAEASYLEKYEGALIAPEIRISRTADPNDPNEVDAIAGGTRTSSAFQNILNITYAEHLIAWQSVKD